MIVSGKDEYLSADELAKLLDEFKPVIQKEVSETYCDT